MCMLSADVAKILIDEVALRQRVRELGEQISRDYCGQDLLLVCILKGGVVFLSDLMRHIDVPHEIEFMAISSYGDATESSGIVRIMMDLAVPIKGRNVLIVEDIVDTGYTLAYVKGLLSTREPASIRICALLDKAERRKAPLQIDYVGFEIPNEFVVGYGLDFQGRYRNLPYVAVLKPERYRKQPGK
jgi:hypoxanthine phosphoribosyltransferase